MSRQLNYRELFTRYPLGREQFDGEWVRLWNEVQRLLDAPAAVFKQGDATDGWATHIVATLLQRAIVGKEWHRGAWCIRLLDGTIVREWSTTPMGEQIRTGLKDTFGSKTRRRHRS
jgi:hypothetical protein